MRRSATSYTLRTLAAALLLFIGFGAGWIGGSLFGSQLPLGADVLALLGPGAGANTASPASIRQQFSVFWQVWNLVDGEFYSTTPIDHEKMIRGAIRGMLESLDDQYTIYQEPELASQTAEHMQGHQAGIGTYLRITDGRAYLYKPFKNAPASRAGLKQDDEIVAIDGHEIGPLIAGLNIHEAAVKVAAQIRGDAGTQVRLTIRRAADGKVLDTTLTREDIVVSSVDSQMLGDGIAYLRISEFKANTTSEFDDAMRDLLRQRPKGLVLDLRNNPGGFLQNAQDVLGRFYDGVALYEEQRNGGLKQLETNRGPADARVGDLPVVVLVNGNTASASEIVAGALHDRRKAPTYLLGEKTYGKGSVQNIHSLSDGGSARITIAHWLTPAKTAINKLGLTPQFVVPYSEDAAMSAPCVADRQPAPGQTLCGDSQLYWGIQMLTTGETPPVVAAAAKP